MLMLRFTVLIFCFLRVYSTRSVTSFQPRYPFLSPSTHRNSKLPRAVYNLATYSSLSLTIHKNCPKHRIIDKIFLEAFWTPLRPRPPAIVKNHSFPYCSAKNSTNLLCTNLLRQYPVFAMGPLMIHAAIEPIAMNDFAPPSALRRSGRK